MGGTTAVAHGGNHGSCSWGEPPRPHCLPKTALPPQDRTASPRPRCIAIKKDLTMIEHNLPTLKPRTTLTVSSPRWIARRQLVTNRTKIELVDDPPDRLKGYLKNSLNLVNLDH
ncbi:MAG: hypothetical protein F6J90_42020 [Moorea sp. SIOASIH]|uniref:hypothetical protein n=1 Tax=Moorena sp. SIOASIH TaxID=2607817 RepID=UPI0013B67AD3|nr:hypothetical protein [Moorena sp. SIOASIH]NEO42547.1 hypothetical protein [Moorena sp. SIOASIH]